MDDSPVANSGTPWVPLTYGGHPTPSESNILSKLVTSISDLQVSETIRRIPTDKLENSDTVYTLLQSPLGSPLPLHASLSQPLILQTLQREAFLDALVLQLRRTSVRPFTVRFATLKWVANQESTRWFLVLGMERPHGNELNRLLDACNTVAERFALLPLYRSGSGGEPCKPDILKRGDISRGRASDHSECFHISIAWSLNPPEAGMMDMTLHSEAVTARMEKEVRKIEVGFDAVKVKIGNTVSSVDLSARARERAKGILG